MGHVVSGGRILVWESRVGQREFFPRYDRHCRRQCDSNRLGSDKCSQPRAKIVVFGEVTKLARLSRLNSLESRIAPNSHNSAPVGYHWYCQAWFLTWTKGWSSFDTLAMANRMKRTKK